MLVIGLLIAAAAAAFGAVVTVEDWGGSTYAVRGFGHHLANLTLAEIFLAGVILCAIFFFGLWLSSLSSTLHRRRSLRRRAEMRSLREQYEEVVAERDRLARELEAQRGRTSDAAAYPREPQVERDDAHRLG
ncbi:MAG: hypothetical protein IRZ27_02970 [Acidothermus cellulolyticus]|nr:hypothetical protein [Acidothermus cellulolyticus]MCL6549591.1 hypothetical protein [Acidothermus cellulolyticus]